MKQEERTPHRRIAQRFQLPPPANWQDFENLCWRLWKSIWNDPNAQKNGRQGQSQAGVDVFGQPDRGQDWAGVQCKGKDLYSQAKLTTTEVEAEVENAKAFKPSLSEFIIATSGPRTVQTQQLAREISDKHRSDGLFSVHVYGWDDIVDRLREFPKLYLGYLESLGRDSSLKIGPPRLPRTTELLLGRDTELARLDEAWESDSQNVLSIVAWGGVGKTALVKHWMGRLAADQFRGAERVFEWSFYSQGTREQASADQFIDQALRFFGDPDPAQGGPHEKGERLASLVNRYKTLLILDGLEPLQYPPGPLGGQVKDPALDILIKKLSIQNPGLCLITTREELSDIAHLKGITAPAMDLEHLSSDAGAFLLNRLGVKGTDEELPEASAAFAGHALALTLLGTYLSEVHNGDVRHWKEVPLLDEDAPQGGHARWVIQSYQKWLGEGPEWSLLLLMGFFDRPAKGADIQALLAEPPIQGLTEEILKLDQPARKRALSRLRRLRLLAESPPDDPDGMDAHPLLREYLSEQLHGLPEACREGHRRLYEHLKASAKELPDTIEEMMPLYQAVAHGCRIGLHQEAFTEVYRGRIHRRSFFATDQLGAFGTDLAAVTSFFEYPWNRPSDNLTKHDQSFVLNEAGFCLRALGRLSEATEPMRAGLEAYESSEEWAFAARVAGNLSELRLTLGDLPQAVQDARCSVELADRSGDAFHKIGMRTTLADALHQSGDLAQAHSLFQEAERLQKEFQPQYPLPYSLQGFRYCDLLLGGCESPAWHPQASPAPSRLQTLSRCRQVRQWSIEALKFDEGRRVLLHIALDQLTLGRTFLLEAALDAPSSAIPSPQPQPPASSLQTEALSQSRQHLDRAVTGLRQAGQQNMTPHGFIARAQLHRLQGDFEQARQDLAEASQIASRGPMPLYQADIHLEHSRLQLAQGNLAQARQSLAEARKLVDKHGYHRRDGELEAMGKELGE